MFSACHLYLHKTPPSSLLTLDPIVEITSYLEWSYPSLKRKEYRRTAARSATTPLLSAGNDNAALANTGGGKAPQSAVAHLRAGGLASLPAPQDEMKDGRGGGQRMRTCLMLGERQARTLVPVPRNTSRGP